MQTPQKKSFRFEVFLILKSLASFATGTVNKEFLFFSASRDFKEEPISSLMHLKSNLVETSPNIGNLLLGNYYAGFIDKGEYGVLDRW